MVEFSPRGEGKGGSEPKEAGALVGGEVSAQQGFRCRLIYRRGEGGGEARFGGAGTGNEEGGGVFHPRKGGEGLAQHAQGDAAASDFDDILASVLEGEAAVGVNHARVR